MKLISAEKFLSRSYETSMPRFEDAAEYWWDSDSSPHVVLFISHRWRSQHHPDPDGATCRLLQSFFSLVDRLARGIDPSCQGEIPKLDLATGLPACHIVNRLFNVDIQGELALSNLAFFYDYSCLPQGSNEVETAERLRGLATFPQLIPDAHVTLIALREEGDDYVRRAWCMAESLLAMDQKTSIEWERNCPLRLNFSNPADISIYAPLSERFTEWSELNSGKQTISGADFESWLELLEVSIEWFRKERDNASHYLHHTGVAAQVSFQMYLNTMIRVAELSESGEVVDLSEIVRYGAESVDLECTDELDLVPAGLLILAGLQWEKLNRGDNAPDEVDVWKAAFDRYCRSENLLARVTANRRDNGELRMPTIQFIEDSD